MFGRIRGVFTKANSWRRERKVIRELKKVKTCILERDLKCVRAHLEEATRHDDCSMCKKEIRVFKRQVRRLPRSKQLEKVDLLIKISGPAAYIVPRMRQIRMIKPKQKQASRQRARSR